MAYAFYKTACNLYKASGFKVIAALVIKYLKKQNKR